MIFDYLYNKTTVKRLIILLACTSCFGLIANIFSQHKLFFVNWSMLVIMLLIQVNVIREIKNEKKQIKKCIERRNEPEVLSLFILKVERLPSMCITDIISTGLVILYIITMFAVGCLAFTITGFYGGILGGIVFYIGIQAYLQYISLLYFSYKLRNTQIKEYSFYSPAFTDWIRKLAYELRYIEKWFLVLGLMYCIIYAINLPHDIIQIEPNISINSSNNILLIITWIGILVFFVIAFPLFTYLSRLFIKDIIYNCKCSSLDKIEVQLSILSDQSSEKDLDRIEHLISLVKTIFESEEYPIGCNRTIFDKMYVILLQLLTLASPLLSLVEDFISKI